MSEVIPPLSPNIRPPVEASLQGGSIIGSGVVVTHRDHLLKLVVGNLTFDVKFEDGEGEHAIRMEKNGDAGLLIVLHNFNNPLGTSLNPTRVGRFSDTPLYLGLYVEGVGEAVRVLSYTFVMGGSFG